MFVRIEVAIRPEYSDPTAQSLLKRIHSQSPELRKKIRWARLIDVYWLDIPRSREDIIPACQEIFQERVTQWLFTGNLIPSASGKQGGLEDLMEASPVRPGNFWGLERRLRTGLTDSRAQAALEALRVVLGSDLPGATTATGQLLLLEGAQLTEADLTELARDIWCNEISETWTLLPEHELVSNERFHQEKKHREDVPRFDGGSTLARPSLQGFARKLGSRRLTSTAAPAAAQPDRALSIFVDEPEKCLEYSKLRGWEWTAEHWDVIRQYCQKRQGGKEPSDLELALIATAWSEQARGRIWSGEFVASDGSRSYFNLLSETLGATLQQQPKSWVISSSESRPAVLALSEEVWISWGSRVSSDANARDPFAETLNTILGVQRDLLGSDCLSVPILQTQVYEGDPLKKGIILRSSELASNRTQVPMLSGADLGQGMDTGSAPLLVVSGVGAALGVERGHVRSGDRMGWLVTGISGPASLEDPVSQRKVIDALRDAEVKGLLGAVRSSGPLPAVWGAIQLAQEGGGSSLTLPPSQLGDFLTRRESLVVSVRPDRWSELKALMDSWGVQLVPCGQFENSGCFKVTRDQEVLASLELGLLWTGSPKKKVVFSVSRASNSAGSPEHAPFRKGGDQILRDLLSHPQVRSPERVLQAFDLEAQAHTVLKPMHSVAVTEGDWVQGPNDGAAVVVQTQSSASGLLDGQQQMVATSVGAKSRASGGGNPWRAWMAVDEALRNLVCTGAQVGAEDSVCALSVQWKGESPERHPDSAQELVETLEAIKDASLSLGIPVLTSAASFSSKPMMGSLVCHAIGRLRAVRWARSADFKGPGDAVYLLGPESVSLVGSLFAELFGLADDKAVTMPQWSMSRRLYGWLGGVQGKEQGRVRSLHDVSDGGLLVAIAEGLMARNLGISLRMPDGVFPEAWAFGEGFHRLVLSCSEADSAILESEWETLAIPYRRLGSVTASARMELQGHWSVPVGDLRKAWRVEEEWR